MSTLTQGKDQLFPSTPPPTPSVMPQQGETKVKMLWRLIFVMQVSSSNSTPTQTELCANCGFLGNHIGIIIRFKTKREITSVPMHLFRNDVEFFYVGLLPSSKPVQATIVLPQVFGSPAFICCNTELCKGLYACSKQLELDSFLACWFCNQWEHLYVMYRCSYMFWIYTLVIIHWILKALILDWEYEEYSTKFITLVDLGCLDTTRILTRNVQASI